MGIKISYGLGLISGLVFLVLSIVLGSYAFNEIFIDGPSQLTIERAYQEETNPKTGTLINLEIRYNLNTNMCRGNAPDFFNAQIQDSNGIITTVKGYSKFKESRRLTIGESVYFVSWNYIILDYGRVGDSPDPINVRVSDAQGSKYRYRES